MWSAFAAASCENMGVGASKETVNAALSPAQTDLGLRHVMVVGGSIDEWNGLSDQQWSVRLAELGKIADHVGASWLTIRPYMSTRDGSVAAERTATAGACLIAVTPQGDGRQRFVDVLQALRTRESAVTEQAITELINWPALVDPDLVVVLGPSNRMPPSMVWELAYSELVFLDIAWADLQADHLDQAIVDFTKRHRRFGGLD